MKQSNSLETVRYIPIGDSYTIGQGVASSQNYPSLLTKHLKESGVNIVMVRNPAMSGWATRDVVIGQLSVFEKEKPTFATLLIGANDIFRGIDEEIFRKNLNVILDRMQSVLVKKDNLIVLTIPDFSLTPEAKETDYSEMIAPEIKKFNAIITRESANRGLPVVDIYTISQALALDSSLVSPDGLHPSAKEYTRWEKAIFPVALELLTNASLTFPLKQ